MRDRVHSLGRGPVTYAYRPRAWPQLKCTTYVASPFSPSLEAAASRLHPRGVPVEVGQLVGRPSPTQEVRDPGPAGRVADRRRTDGATHGSCRERECTPRPHCGSPAVCSHEPTTVATTPPGHTITAQRVLLGPRSRHNREPRCRPHVCLAITSGPHSNPLFPTRSVVLVVVRTPRPRRD